MEETACGCDCPLVKSGVCQTDRQCPNFIETWWQEGEQGKPKLIADCAPRRILLQQATMASNLIGVQASVEQVRNTVDKLCSILSTLTMRSQDYLEHQKSISTDKIEGES